MFDKRWITTVKEQEDTHFRPSGRLTGAELDIQPNGEGSQPDHYYQNRMQNEQNIRQTNLRTEHFNDSNKKTGYQTPENTQAITSKQTQT